MSTGKRNSSRAASALLEEAMNKAKGGGLVLDGGFATQLEKHGAEINDPLWSAISLIKEPHLIKKVHMEYLEAGADILVTSSYQATIPGFLSRGISIEEAERLLQMSVKLAREARDRFWETMEKIPEHSYNRALVAASIGSYGAYLADGSEYRYNTRKVWTTIITDFARYNASDLEFAYYASSGSYGPDVTLDKLKDFHRRRVQVLVEAGADLLAFETIPNKLEALACVQLLDEENVQIPSWICFSSVDGEHAPSGESFKECLDVINKSDKVSIVGINCTPPHFMETLINKFRELTEKVIAIYPNSGEVWDGRAKKWLRSECFDDDKFKLFATKWHNSGAKIIGGCCRTTPSTIRGISEVLKQKF